jgi:hypothetical protein
LRSDGAGFLGNVDTETAQLLPALMIRKLPTMADLNLKKEMQHEVTVLYVANPRKVNYLVPVSSSRIR